MVGLPLSRASDRIERQLALPDLPGETGFGPDRAEALFFWAVAKSRPAGGLEVRAEPRERAAPGPGFKALEAKAVARLGCRRGKVRDKRS
jgi:hypothetical protein